jgi:pimeloyl-ACP methyl ester carboxylesterase
MNSFSYKELLPDEISGEHSFSVGTDGVKIHYIRKGEGTPFLLLHGWPGFWYDWRHVFEPLSKFADVIAPDFRGFGDSDKPDVPPLEGYTPDHLAKDIISLLEELNIRSAVVVAHDIGATVAQLIARKYPEYIKGMVLLNPPYNGIGTRRFDPAIQGQFWYQHFHHLSWAGNLIGYNEETVKLYLTHFYNEWIGNKDSLREKELQAIIKTYAKNDAIKKSINYYKARAQAKTPQALQGLEEQKIKQKTSVLWGEKDPVMLAEWSDRLHLFFENYNLEKLPGVGHFVPFEAPDAVVKTVRELLKTITWQD